MNNESMENASKKYCLDKMKASTHLTLILKYNPETFALYDNGEELRRITALSITPAITPSLTSPATGLPAASVPTATTAALPSTVAQPPPPADASINPSFLIQSYDVQIVNVTLRRGDAGFGVNFVGPTDDTPKTG